MLPQSRRLLSEFVRGHCRARGPCSILRTPEREWSTVTGTQGWVLSYHIRHGWVGTHLAASGRGGLRVIDMAIISWLGVLACDVGDRSSPCHGLPGFAWVSPTACVCEGDAAPAASYESLGPAMDSVPHPQ